MARSIWGTLSPFAHRPRFLTRPPSLSLGVYFLSSRTRAFNHERNTAAIPHSLSSPALDSSREPRRHVGRTGEISKDWLASTESLPEVRKEMIQSLVERHTNGSNSSTDKNGKAFDDIIQGKGQGLVILLQYDSGLNSTLSVI